MWKSISRKRLVQYASHSVYWILILLFYTYYFGFDSQDLHYVFGFVCFLMPVTMGTTYYINYKLIPDFLWKGKYGLFVLHSLYTLIVSTYLIMVSVFAAFIFLAENNYGNMAPLSRNYTFIIVGQYIVIFLFTTIRQLQNNHTVVNRNKALRHLMLQADLKLKEQELQYLKTQIHPHFLFNMLNTLYGMALKKDDYTADTIMRLSGLLDYILYRVNQPQVTLNKELEHLNDYVSLERLRFGDKLAIDIRMDHIDPDYAIAPLLLIPFIENSFKHGGFREGKLIIKGEISIRNERLYFYLKNSKPRKDTLPCKGIGIHNIKRRLQLMYDDSYDLKIMNEAHWFTVELMLGKLKGAAEIK